MDGEDGEDGEWGEQDVEELCPYLGASRETGVHDIGLTEPTHTSMDDDISWVTPQRPAADGLNNTYLCTFDINGIHHLAMVKCNCHG